MMDDRGERRIQAYCTSLIVTRTKHRFVFPRNSNKSQVVLLFANDMSLLVMRSKA